MNLIELEIKISNLEIATYYRLRRWNWLFQGLNFSILMLNLYSAFYMNHYDFITGVCCGVSGIGLFYLIVDLAKQKSEMEYHVKRKAIYQDIQSSNPQ